MVKLKTVKRIGLGIPRIKSHHIGLSEGLVGGVPGHFNIQNDSTKNNVLVTDKLLLPKLRGLPASGTPGQIVFNSGDNSFYGWNGSEWVSFSSGGGDGSFERVTLPGETEIDPNITKSLIQGSPGFDSSAVAAWATKVAGTGYDSPYWSRLASINDSSQVLLGVIYDSDPLNVYNTNGSFAFSLPLTAYDTALIRYSPNGIAHCVGRLGSIDGAEGSSIQINNADNIIVAGYYYQTISVYNGDLSLSFEMSNMGSDDAFLIKYSIGGVAEWGTKLSGVNSDAAYSCAINSQNDISLVGNFNSPEIDIYNSDGTIAASFTLTGSFNGFVAKYDADGFLDWAAKTESDGAVNFYGTDINETGEILAGGYSDGTFVIIYNENGTVGASFAISSRNLLLIKYTSTGTVSWATRIECVNSSIDSVKTNVGGNIYASGLFDADLSIYNSNGSFAATLVFTGPNTNNFLIKYTSGGMYEWAVPIVGTGFSNPSCYTNNADTAFIAGRYSDVLQIYNQDGTLAFTLAPEVGASSPSAYLIKYDPIGDACWATKVGNINNSSGDSSFAVACNNIGEIVLAGEYASSPVNVYNSDGSVAATLDNEGSADAFIVKYNDVGQITLGNPTTDGQRKTITTNGPAVQIIATSSIEGVNQSVLLNKYDAVEMLWDAVESNWIVVSNEGTLI